MRVCTRIIFLGMLSIGILVSCCAAQIPGLTPSTPAATTASATPAVQADPLGRDNPRGCVLGFIKAAQDERYGVAALYFEPPARRTRINEDEEGGRVSGTVADVVEPEIRGPAGFYQPRSTGRLDDGLPADQEKVSGVLGTSNDFPIYLVRREDEQGHKLWYFSRSTLQQVPEAYEALQFPQFEKQIPKALVEHRLLAMPLWQWLALVLFIPLCLFAGRVLAYALSIFTGLTARSVTLRCYPLRTSGGWGR